jgi:hypothetical protein
MDGSNKQFSITDIAGFLDRCFNTISDGSLFARIDAV